MELVEILYIYVQPLQMVTRGFLDWTCDLDKSAPPSSRDRPRGLRQGLSS